MPTWAASRGDRNNRNEMDGKMKNNVLRTACMMAVTAMGIAELSAAVSPNDESEPKAELLSALAALQAHVEGRNKLEAPQIEARKLTVDQHRELFGSDAATIKASFDLVAAYDRAEGPLWIAQNGFSRGSNRQPTPPPNDMPWTIFSVMQNIMDRVYTATNVARFPELLNGFKFGSSSNFPGAVAAPADPRTVHRVKINASCPKPFKHEVMHQEVPARRPTGTYLAPGTLATVTVPSSLVGKGYAVRVGTHSWDFGRKPRVLRLDRASLVYPITRTDTTVASPLGGGLYLEVPLHADAGIVEVAIRNALRSPYFSLKPFHQTSLEEWRSVERNQPGPWADFQTEKFLMQVPSSWIRKLDDPLTLMRDWDLAMDAQNDLMGLPRVWGKETMFLQVDLMLRASVFAPGYPTANDRYDPKKDYDGYANHYLVRGPQFAPDYVFHEQGHGFGFVKFGGETESTVNLAHVAVQNQCFGQTLDAAFAGSRNMQGNKHRTLDNTAVSWMSTSNFVNRKPMDSAQKAYQLEGHAKYVDLARLFGWKVLGDFWRSWVEDFEAGRPWLKHGMDSDKLSLRLSEKAGVDLTPLLHFWGIPPRDAKALQAAVAASKLPPSAKVYDTLVRYQSLVPKDHAAFRAFATGWWGRPPRATGFQIEREHAQQWENYSEQTAAQIRKTMQSILDQYFPGGRPRGQ